MKEWLKVYTNELWHIYKKEGQVGNGKYSGEM